MVVFHVVLLVPVSQGYEARDRAGRRINTSPHLESITMAS